MNRKRLPTERDFDPFGGCLDAQCAWRNFGGLTLDEAHARFSENPLYYQEDFMFMGHGALAYYFPVIDKYMRSGDDDDQARIIAQGLFLQFQLEDTSLIEPLKPSIIDLATFVIENIEKFGDDEKERRQVSDAWGKLVKHGANE